MTAARRLFIIHFFISLGWQGDEFREYSYMKLNTKEKDLQLKNMQLSKKFKIILKKVSHDSIKNLFDDDNVHKSVLVLAHNTYVCIQASQFVA